MDADRRRDDRAGRFAYDGLDRLLHERSRLGILASLSSSPDGRSFGELKSMCSLTDGNLSRHLQTLSEAGLVTLRKVAGDRRTICRLTVEGRARFEAYVDELERVLRDAQAIRREATRDAPSIERGQVPPGWLPA